MPPKAAAAQKKKDLGPTGLTIANISAAPIPFTPLPLHYVAPAPADLPNWTD